MPDNFWKNLIGAFYVPTALTSIAMGILTPVLPLYASNLTDAYALIGFMLAANGLGTILADVPASWVLRRIGIKRTMQVGLLLNIMPMVALFFVQDIGLAIVLLLIAGTGYAFYHVARYGYISLTIPQSVRGRSIGLLGGMFRIGKFVGPLLGGFIGGALSLNSAFLVFAMMNLIGVLVIERYLNLPETDEDGNEQYTIAHAPMLATFKSVLKTHWRVFMSAGVGQIFAQLTRQGLLVIIPLYGANVLGLDVQTIGLIMGIGSGVDLLLFYTGGIIMDKWGRKWAIVPSFVVQGTCIFLILLAGDAISLTAIAILIGIANATSSGTMTALGADFAPYNGRGEFLSVWSLIGDIGFMGAPLIVGMVAQVFALQMSIVAIGSIGWGTALLFGLFVPETLKKKE